ncbi:FAD-dependent oxidoreductase [Clostridium sp. C2-6-12]|uniref:NAD(P)-binding protein n=1 Tax=Clostridium sp. C2-6-12 TaxID=2698832 RepID=UPI001371BDAB|nr:FAD-dependent oxidoreductase [Clostridium sp. C2-6-12]
MVYTKIVLGAGLYGLYSALFCGKRGEKILVLEHDSAPFKRATYINQARVHMGYHYPRSYSTAIKSAHYFDRFMEDYAFCVLTEFEKVYATSANFSWTSSEQFMKFCKAANIHCEDINPSKYFNDRMCDGAFLTKEYTYDANILKEYFLSELQKYPNVQIKYDVKIRDINQAETHFDIILENGENYSTDFLLNATYASCNQILNKLGYEPFKIKYELCEIILCKVSDKLKNVGITVMDGPFFSIMPFGKTGYHSLTSVTFTPHMTSYDSLPKFECQEKSNGFCSPEQLGNCNECPAKPQSAWTYMSNMAKKYLKEEYEFEYASSLFSMKPILKASEIDDSRPTVIKQYSSIPRFISVLSGKINTVYDLDEVLTNGNK